jgi:hypothetical protein
VFTTIGSYVPAPGTYVLTQGLHEFNIVGVLTNGSVSDQIYIVVVGDIPEGGHNDLIRISTAGNIETPIEGLNPTSPLGMPL